MAEQTQFLQKVIDRSSLETENQAQTATNIVFRILRDMVSRETVDHVGEDLQMQDPDADMALNDLWKDTNPMVSFFSRLSPVQKINFSPTLFMSRLNEEAALPVSVEAEEVVKAVFSALKKSFPMNACRKLLSRYPRR